MDFELAEEQEMLRKTVREFVERECPKERARNLDRAKEFPVDMWDRIAEVGFLGIPIPEEYGGQGGTVLDQTIVLEELSRRSTALGYAFFLSSCFGGKSIEYYGNEEQKQHYLPRLANGEIRFALAMTEPSGGSDILSLSTFAEPHEDHYVVNGQKIFISNAQVAHYLIAVTRTQKDPEKRSRGLSILVIPADAKGVTITPIETVGIWGTGTNEVLFDDVAVPRENLLGEEGGGWYHLTKTLNNERILTAATDVGIAQAALEDMVDYAKEREAFGRPIGEYQAIQHYIADSAVELETARLLTYKAAWLETHGKPCDVEATMAKLWAANVACRAADKGIQVLGGYGYTMEFDMQRYWRDSRLNRLGPISDEMARNYIAMKLGLPKSY